MKLLSARNQQIRRENRRVAELGSAYADAMGGARLTSEDLWHAQDGLRRQLLWVQRRRRHLRSRVGQWDVRAQLRPWLRDARRTHVALLREQLRLVGRQEIILRVIGDGLAWRVLREDPRLLAPLYKKGKHEIPTNIALAGPVMVAQRASASGSFYVIENDITRVLGVGDLTVVFADRPWNRPLSLELKTSGRFVKGAVAEIWVVHASSTDPADATLAREFCESVGLRDMPEHVAAKDRPDQTRDMLARAELLLAATAGARTHVSLGGRAWRGVGTVLERGLAEGMCWDLPEPGVAMFAVHSEGGRPTVVADEALRDFGFDPQRAVTTEDFLRRDSWSALVPPIPIWPVSRSARAALMTGELVFGCIVLPGIMTEAMRSKGLKVQVQEDGTVLVSGRVRTASLDAIESHKLVLGVSLGGVSPRDIAARLAALLGPTAER